MGSITSSLFISLDGVIEAPETWHFDYFDDEMGAAVGALMSSADATLFGRQTYEEMAAYWPAADPQDPFTAQMNGARKYVVSDTLAEATWENSSIISGDVVAELTALKQETRLGTTGSATLVQLDVGAGSGRRAAPAGASRRRRSRQEAVHRRRQGAARAPFRHDVRDGCPAPRLRPGGRLTQVVPAQMPSSSRDTSQSRSALAASRAYGATPVMSLVGRSTTTASWLLTK